MITKAMIAPDVHIDASGAYHPAIWNMAEDRMYYWPNITMPDHNSAWERANLSCQWAEEYLGGYIKEWNIYPTY